MRRLNLTRKLFESHRVSGSMEAGEELALKVDHTLTQDATGTLVMLAFEAMEIDRVRTELSAQYVDHNLIQQDFRNPDDHLFLQSACRKFGLWFSPAGNGVSHPLHQERFGIPGKTLVGSDSHTPAAGALGMLAFGAGGLEVALAMAGRPLFLKMPLVVGVRLTGRLPDWVSAKDVVLEMLRRYDVKGGANRIFEYHGPGLDGLSAMDRHVIANMGTEMGATTSVFPSDGEVRRFLASQQREGDWVELLADEDADYDEHVELDLSSLEPLIALPGSPGNVRPVREVAGEPVYQAYVGSSANPGLRDFAVPAMMVEGRHVHPGVSFDINPTSRQMLESLTLESYLGRLIRAGARIHQAGCNGCIGMGQAPATDRNSLRTVPRNFPGRSGTREDRVFLCSPETATAAALTGKITDPRELGMDYPRFGEPQAPKINREMFVAPADEAGDIELTKGPNIKTLPDLEPIARDFRAPVLIKLGDNVSTDDILPAGSEILPLRSNIPAISDYVFRNVGREFSDRAGDLDAFVIVAGKNYGQGSSREHAALAPRFLGLRLVCAQSYGRIHWQNLVNFGVIPLSFADPDDYASIEEGDELAIDDPVGALEAGGQVDVHNKTRKRTYTLQHELSQRQIDVIRAGSLINRLREEDR
ncbi:Aconitate hydratase [Thioalkalivibrio nitratireducens DSM 14787]|uniref:Aconitate hydratase n=1 Tax=Thioalkalivibrio nitratireducens (strain DSM 14787 / UNIQEM 213 / ALEN2) TaxID=1255043 RepID=L0DR21_THIND|nr:aconitate hydratase [Thioalkalivibrio nitratireducens]AGA32029.1 Aconitate hydratase [Thioalkalivibrio nitratireducens DSM 14787]